MSVTKWPLVPNRRWLARLGKLSWFTTISARSVVSWSSNMRNRNRCGPLFKVKPFAPGHVDATASGMLPRCIPCGQSRGPRGGWRGLAAGDSPAPAPAQEGGVGGSQGLAARWQGSGTDWPVRGAFLMATSWPLGIFALTTLP